jgi:hypothetical protein
LLPEIKTRLNAGEKISRFGDLVRLTTTQTSGVSRTASKAARNERRMPAENLTLCSKSTVAAGVSGLQNKPRKNANEHESKRGNDVTAPLTRCRKIGK